MQISISGQNRLMVVIVRDYRNKFMGALGLSAQRGGFKGDMAGMVSRLVAWERKPDTDFQAWFTLTQEAGTMWMEWYDWYTRLDNQLGRAS